MDIGDKLLIKFNSADELIPFSDPGVSTTIEVKCVGIFNENYIFISPKQVSKYFIWKIRERSGINRYNVDLKRYGEEWMFFSSKTFLKNLGYL